MPTEFRTEVGEVHPRYWKNTVKEAFKNDPYRIIIELIKNAADSYTRLEKEGKKKPPFEIFIKVFCEKKATPIIEVYDYAQGMDSKKLREALKYGTQTSMGEDTEATTSAEKGIGLKDAMMALEENWLITIKDGLINERKKHADFKTGIGREDEKVTTKEREELGITANGTVVKGYLPDYFKDRKFTTICEYLQKHFLMKKLLQNPEYKIYAIDNWAKEKKLLTYQPPQIEKKVLERTFNIKYNREEYPVRIIINKSKEELPQGKPFGDSGLLFYYGKYTVLDFTFCRFDRDISFSKFFGEVRMEVEKLIRDPEEATLVDEKRRGLDTTHPFNIELIENINTILKEIQEEQESSKYSFDEPTKREILKELNKISKDIKGRGPPPPPIEPKFFEFHPPYASIREYEPKKIFLVINSSIVLEELEIRLKSTNPKITLMPDKIKIDKNTIKEEFIIKQIELNSKEAQIKGEIIAESENPKYSTKIGVEVLENPMFSPTNGFAFVPDKTTIIDEGEKTVDLCIDKDVINGSKEIELSSQDPINCPGKWMLPETTNLEKSMIKNIIKLEIPIKVKGKGHIGKKAVITARYIDISSDLEVKIVPEPSITGLFRDIRLSAKDTKEISKFVDEEGIIEVYYKHPLMKKYMKKDFRNKIDFLAFVADTIAREVIKAIVLSGIKENSSRFPVFDTDNPQPDIERYTIQQYYEHGPKMHELFTKLAKKFELSNA